MGVNETVGDVENVGGKVGWSTGDAEKDWARYQGLFDRIDQGLRFRLACLLAFDGVLILALSGERSANFQFNVVFDLLVLWLAFAVSLVMYWSQFHALSHRRYLCGVWGSVYRNSQPTPFASESATSGPPAVAPSALIALLSALIWLVMTGITLGRGIAPTDAISQSGLMGVVRAGVLIATGLALVALYVLMALHDSSRGLEKEPPRE